MEVYIYGVCKYTSNNTCTHTHTHTKCACTTHTGECPMCLCLCAHAAIYMSFMKERREIRSRKLGFRDSALRSAHSVIPRSSNAEYPDTRNGTELPHGITEYRARNRARCNHGIIGWLNCSNHRCRVVRKLFRFSSSEDRYAFSPFFCLSSSAHCYESSWFSFTSR